jgi:hypothetical protein
MDFTQTLHHLPAVEYEESNAASKHLDDAWAIGPQGVCQLRAVLACWVFAV